MITIVCFLPLICSLLCYQFLYVQNDKIKILPMFFKKLLCHITNMMQLLKVFQTILTEERNRNKWKKIAINKSLGGQFYTKIILKYLFLLVFSCKRFCKSFFGLSKKPWRAKKCLPSLVWHVHIIRPTLNVKKNWVLGNKNHVLISKPLTTLTTYLLQQKWLLKN